MQTKLLLLISIVALTFLGGCNFFNRNTEVIPEEKFIDVLVDMHLTDGAMVAKNLLVRRDSIAIDKYYNGVFFKHQITYHQFNQTLMHYSNNIEQFDMLYDEVLNKLSKIEEQIKKEEEERKEEEKQAVEERKKANKRRIDSLKRMDSLNNVKLQKVSEKDLNDKLKSIE